MSGGACFTPRLARRPPYPPAPAVLRRALLSYIRVPVICAAIAMCSEGPFRLCVEAMLASGWTEQWIFVAMTFCVHTCCYVGINGFFFACAKIGWLSEYQFDRKPYQIPSDALLRRTWWEALHFGMPSLTEPLPASFARLCVGFATAHFVNDVGFYWSHRAVHHPSLYKHIHKQHHAYTGSIGFAAEYASPLESIISNALPTIGGMLFFGCHGSALLFLVWLAVRLQQTYEAHSGFCFYGTVLYKWFGLTLQWKLREHEWLDWICGTMDAWVDLGGTTGYIELCRKNATRAADAVEEVNRIGAKKAE
eukprot:g4491.t1